ncbi:MAG: phosphoglycolate phosphatase [Gaiellaceae bacterium]|nr:phosphoglycolate phosphatase [Gaiellaceae bacterium]
MPGRLLVLFDIDGTLLLTHDPLMGQAVVETLEEAYAVSLPADAIDRVDHAGQTAKRIARLVLYDAGLDEEAIDAHLDPWCARSAARYLELLAAGSTADWRAAPGADETLRALREKGHRLALLTGNPEPAARARMERLGLAGFFPPGQGGFGCDGEARAALIDVARRRAGGWSAGHTVEVGDTCRDVGTAHDAGARSVAIASGRVERARLAAADAVIASLEELPAVLEAF